MTSISSADARTDKASNGAPLFAAFFLKANINMRPQRIGIVR